MAGVPKGFHETRVATKHAARQPLNAPAPGPCGVQVGSFSPHPPTDAHTVGWVEADTPASFRRVAALRHVGGSPRSKSIGPMTSVSLDGREARRSRFPTIAGFAPRRRQARCAGSPVNMSAPPSAPSNAARWRTAGRRCLMAAPPPAAASIGYTPPHRSRAPPIARTHRDSMISGAASSPHGAVPAAPVRLAGPLAEPDVDPARRAARSCVTHGAPEPTPGDSASTSGHPARGGFYDRVLYHPLS